MNEDRPCMACLSLPKTLITYRTHFGQYRLTVPGAVSAKTVVWDWRGKREDSSMGLAPIRAKPCPVDIRAQGSAGLSLRAQSREAARHERQRGSTDVTTIFARKNRPPGFVRSVPIPYYYGKKIKISLNRIKHEMYSKAQKHYVFHSDHYGNV